MPWSKSNLLRLRVTKTMWADFTHGGDVSVNSLVSGKYGWNFQIFISETPQIFFQRKSTKYPAKHPKQTSLKMLWHRSSLVICCHFPWSIALTSVALWRLLTRTMQCSAGSTYLQQCWRSARMSWSQQSSHNYIKLSMSVWHWTFGATDKWRAT